jgi:hypothetical protein
MGLAPSQHILDILYHQPFMRRREQKNAVRSSVEGRYCWVIVFGCLDRLDKTL